MRNVSEIGPFMLTLPLMRFWDRIVRSSAWSNFPFPQVSTPRVRFRLLTPQALMLWHGHRLSRQLFATARYTVREVVFAIPYSCQTRCIERNTAAEFLPLVGKYRKYDHIWTAALSAWTNRGSSSTESATPYGLSEDMIPDFKVPEG